MIRKSSTQNPPGGANSVRQSPSERLVRDIRRATASSILRKKKSESFSTAFAAKSRSRS